MLPSSRRTPKDLRPRSWRYLAGAGLTASTKLRRQYTRTLAAGAVRLLLDDRSRRSACHRRTCVDADCDAQRAAVDPQCKVRIVSVQGPILVALHAGHASEADMLQRTVWMQPLRYDVNQPNTVGLLPMPYDVSRRRSRVAWSTVSNAADKSSSVNIA